MTASPIPVHRSSRSGARTRWFCLMLLTIASLIATAAPRAGWADVPGRVGRISFMQGDVQSYTEADPQWIVAYPNQPITSRNSVFVGDTGRAEISVGSTTLAMEAGSQVDIQQLDDNTFKANVVRGRVSLIVRRIDSNDTYDVAAPGADFALLRPGRYRIDALDGASGITVFAGQASVEGEGGAVNVPAGGAMRVVVDAQDPNGPPQLLSAAAIPVGIDDWVMTRDERFRGSTAAQRYVSPDMTGYEDLDANGRWASEPEVGPIWYPTTYVQNDWAPYRYGRWAYVRPWGYTWIDDAPWGFAPFHYGRWLQVGGRWGWCPGAYVARPVYAPALVGFYGGANFNASFAAGAGPAVGWYPLAPWQRYTPGYAHSSAYINQVNNITIVNAPQRFGREQDWNRVHGSTIVPQNAFASQRSISRVAIAAPGNLIERGGPINGAELPRPVPVTAAIRRGPEVPGGIVRPEFRSPRNFAQESGPRDDRGGSFARPQAAPGAAAMPQRDFGRRAMEANDPRQPRSGQPASVVESTRAPQAPGPNPANPAAFDRDRDRGVERAVGRQAEPAAPDAPRFSREGRPAQQAIQRSAGEVPNPVSPSVDRLGARQQAMERANGDAFERARQVQQNNERPAREFRTPQAPTAPQAQPAPQQPAALAPQAQPMRPQSIDRPQRIERAAPVAVPAVPAAPTAPVPVAQPRAQAPRMERPSAAEERGGGPPNGGAGGGPARER